MQSLVLLEPWRVHHPTQATSNCTEIALADVNVKLPQLFPTGATAHTLHPGRRIRPSPHVRLGIICVVR